MVKDKYQNMKKYFDRITQNSGLNLISLSDRERSTDSHDKKIKP